MNRATDPCRIRPAKPREAAMLSELAMRSKSHWGYSPAFMDACRAELTYSAAEIGDARRRFAVAERSGTPVGFYALGKASMGAVELEALFVEPGHIRTGVGRALLRHARTAAVSQGARVLFIQGDPHAAAFYEATGAVRIGERESTSIPGRLLPLYSLPLYSLPLGSGEPAAPADARPAAK